MSFEMSQNTEYLIYAVSIILLLIFYHYQKPSKNDSQDTRQHKQCIRKLVKGLIFVVLVVGVLRYMYNSDVVDKNSANMNYGFAKRNQACKVCSNYRGANLHQSGNRKTDEKLARMYDTACNACSKACVDEFNTVKRSANITNSAYLQGQMEDLRKECVNLTQNAINARKTVKREFPNIQLNN